MVLLQSLYVVCRQQLLIAHAVPFQAHECGGMIRPGIAVSLVSADRQLLTVFLQLAHICLKALVMALPDRFVASFAMHKAGFIQLIKLRVGGQHFGQMFRHILLVGFHTQTVPAELLVDFVQQSRDFCKQPVTGFLRRLLPYPLILVGVGLQLRSIDVEMR